MTSEFHTVCVAKNVQFAAVMPTLRPTDYRVINVRHPTIVTDLIVCRPVISENRIEGIFISY